MITGGATLRSKTMVELEPLYPLFIALIAFSLVHWAVGLSLMIRWRDTFPIVGRKLPFVVLTSVRSLSRKVSGFAYASSFHGVCECGNWE